LDSVEQLIVIPQIKLVRLVGFTGSNTINSILIYDAAACPQRLYVRTAGLDSPESQIVLDTKVAQFRSSREMLLEIATSDGCELLVTFEGPSDRIGFTKRT
jgi:hypothetical protein